MEPFHLVVIIIIIITYFRSTLFRLSTSETATGDSFLVS